ncbi:MAG TPA: AAA family ATPase [Ktedonobacteraceae bacterium]|nr:AAA family ATPase [Ktedonobacteraceae bacterium]
MNEHIFGRVEEKALVLALLKEEAVVTLTGPGGIGKTTLALALAHETPWPWWFISLVNVGNAELIVHALAQELGLPDGHRTEQHIIAFFNRTPGLLVLDNFEHLMAGVSIVATLVAKCPELKILVTSRERLQLREEVVVEVPPLPLAEAVSLFQWHVSRTLPQFRVSPENAGMVTKICQHWRAFRSLLNWRPHGCSSSHWKS